MTGGTILGTVQETSRVEHRVLAPPERRRGSRVPGGRGGLPRGPDDRRGRARKREAGRSPCSRAGPIRVPASRSAGACPCTIPLITGQRVIDTLFPLAKGGTVAIPGGFGTGKTMTQHALAKWCDADIIVYIGCGERGNEMTDVLTRVPQADRPADGPQPHGAHHPDRQHLQHARGRPGGVASTPGSPWPSTTATMGYHVAVMADSTSRWAEALRELSGRMEEMPAEEGFPAYLPTRLAEFYERGGLRARPCAGRDGSVTIIGAVSPPGGDFSEPVTQHTKRFVRCFWALDRQLANARHYPAISWLDSYSEYARGRRRRGGRSVGPGLGARTATRDHGAAAAGGAAPAGRQARRARRPARQPALRAARSATLFKNAFLQQNAFDDVDRLLRRRTSSCSMLCT
ncbi:MAG: hypothetical protein M0C28_43480 [Candidatus Moduliflexus flocculans]|nr:hypothetical protein [Candidatus Moduliflexus flocculans]